jgi:peptidoglycan/xylan/chitin deacetylase (PgdA/CDA1 family)
MIKSRLDRPVASIVFDDFAQSAWTVGGRILEDAGARGTYFVAGSYCGREADGITYFEPDDLVAAHGSGHEIGCHTFDHRTVSNLPASEIETSLERNQDFVRGLIGDVIMTSFAFPHGEASIRTKRLIGGHFAACRGIFPGINAGRIDLSQLKGVELVPYVLKNYSIDRMIEAAIASRGWLIFICHDVASEHSPWGCAPQMLEGVVSKLQAARIEMLPIKSALGRVAFAH